MVIWCTAGSKGVIGSEDPRPRLYEQADDIWVDA